MTRVRTIRLFPLLLCLLLAVLPLSALGEDSGPTFDERAAAWQTIAQNSPFYAKNPDYLYNNVTLGAGGCGPTSIANALILSLDVNDEATSRQVMLETLYLLCGGSKPATHAINPNAIGDLCQVDASAYPTLAALCGDLSSIVFTPEQITPEYVQQHAAPDALVIGRSRADTHWEDYIAILSWLHEQGYDNATMAVAFTSAGTEATKTTFSLGAAGHYVTLLFNVGEYYEHGAVYLVDSIPRAISSADRKANSYALIYPFVLDEASHTLRRTYVASRVSDTVIKLSLREETLAQCFGPDGDAARLRFLTLIRVTGRGVMLLSFR